MVLAIRVEMHPSPTDICQSSQAAVRSRERTPYRAIDGLVADLRCRTTFLFLGQRSEPTSPSSTWLTSSVIQCSAAKRCTVTKHAFDKEGGAAFHNRGGPSRDLESNITTSTSCVRYVCTETIQARLQTSETSLLDLTIVRIRSKKRRAATGESVHSRTMGLELRT
ncbi:hypothetical protein B0H13DRAFT_1982663 [Mycena leptocephala]|nr:hypothetical protein B0H13DRAFT_1982663 [Mycena leptocephala]